MLEVMKTDAVSGQVPIPAKEMAKRWTEFNLSIKGKSGKIILNKALYDRSPMSVQLLIRWVTVARMEHKIEDSIAAEMAPPPADPAADKIFDDIDADKDGFLDIKELTEYLLDKFPSSVAHKTLRILDSDQDKKVSRDEWRRGWADGLLGDFVQKEQAKAKEADGEGGEIAFGIRRIEGLAHDGVGLVSDLGRGQTQLLHPGTGLGGEIDLFGDAAIVDLARNVLKIKSATTHGLV